MTIRVSLALRRRAVPSPAVALFVPSRDPVDLFAICARIGLDPSGRIFEVAPGFLLELGRPTTEPVPGAIRLREVARAFYVPADAELTPGLLDDEAAGLVRDRGLVVLPGGRMLWFDRHAVVELGKLIEARPRQGRAWTALPEPRRLAERLELIALELPEPPPEALYRALKEEVRGQRDRSGSEGRKDETKGDRAGENARAPRSAAEGDPSAPQAETSGATPIAAPGEGAEAGSLVPRVGEMLQAFRLMFHKSGEAFDALKEKIQWEWVDHSALLKKLVQEFREGDQERALRRAVPFARHDEPWVPAKAPWLPLGRAVYSLAELLRRPGRGEAVPVRFARDDVTRELGEEYRKAAVRAAQQGDFRRVAYIFGVLLGDDRQAAKALQRAGLHHDAAILYLKKLNDPAAAAAAFESAGEVDRALALYRQLGQHETSGDLLRRLGDEEGALAEYVLAAQLHAASVPPCYRSAGLLLQTKARQPDLAIQYFKQGWDRRPGADATLCALTMAAIHAERGAIEPIRALFDQADELFAGSGSDAELGSFYESMSALAASAALGPYADELRDRCVMALARRLRQCVEAGQSPAPLVTTLFGRATELPTALVSDADFAASLAQKRPRDSAAGAGREPGIRGFQIGRGIVTATAQAAASGEIFLGFDSGLVLGYLPERNQVVKVAEDIHPVTALAVDPEGQTVIALRRGPHGTAMSRWLKRPDGSFRLRPETHFPRPAADARARSSGFEPFAGSPHECWLTPVLPWGVERLIGICQGHELLIVDASSGLTWGSLSIPECEAGVPTTALLLAIGSPKRSWESRFTVLTHVGQQWVLLDLQGKILCQTTSYRWLHGAAGFDSDRPSPITWRHVPPFLEVLGLDKTGAVYAAQLYLEHDSLELLAERRNDRRGLPRGHARRYQQGRGRRAGPHRLAQLWRRAVPYRRPAQARATHGRRVLCIALDPGNPGRLRRRLHRPRHPATTDEGLEIEGRERRP